MDYKPVCYCGRDTTLDYQCDHSSGGVSNASHRLGRWDTPAGNTAYMAYRSWTSDWNTISACLKNPFDPNSGDEYAMPRDLVGWGLDVGAHIGSVTVGLLLDNPLMRVIAIEAVPDNVELIRYNLDRNGVTDRCVVLAGAAWKRSGVQQTIEIEYGYTGSEVAEVHQFIGSISPWMDAPGEKVTATIPLYGLKDVFAITGGEDIAWAKSDCEGCEHHFFKGPLLRKVAAISGEWHLRDGDPERFAGQLSKTHDVTYSEGIGGGPFTAVKR